RSYYDLAFLKKGDIIRFALRRTGARFISQKRRRARRRRVCVCTAGNVRFADERKTIGGRSVRQRRDFRRWECARSSCGGEFIVRISLGQRGSHTDRGWSVRETNLKEE